MSKINLLELDAADLVDVIHYFFDEDMRYATLESAHIHGKFREHLYKGFYNEEYKYSIGGSDSPKTETSPDGTEIKPFMPATEFDEETGTPLDGLLDSPLR